MTLDVIEDRLQKIIFSAGARDPEDENYRKRRGAFNFGGDVLECIFSTPNNDQEELPKHLSESKKP